MAKRQQQANKREPLSLFDEDADENDDTAGAAGQLAVNKNYAERYNNWRGKEEMQKLKDKYGDVGLNENSEEEEESESETEDEDAQELTKDVELEFFRALSLLKSKDKRIYDKENTKFFEAMQKGDGVGGEDESGPQKGREGREAKDKAKKKPYQLKDLEREMVLKRMADAAKGVSIDEDYEEAGELRKDQQLRSQTTKMSYFEEQEDIKRSLKKAMASAGSGEEEASGDEDGGLLTVKQKSKEQAEREEAEYIEWFKGQRPDIGDEAIKKSMGSLHDFWTDPALPESEKFLRDYILNKRYIDGGEEESGSDEEPNEQAADTKKPTEAKKASAGELATLDFVGLSDEEKIIEHQEEFERKYNFRFEEPDPEFIKAYPRTIQDSMRREKTKRREKREETKKRKELEKTQRREEIKRLKNLKRLEIVDKLERLKKVAGLKAEQGARATKGLAGLSEKDLEADFDPDEYERRMQELFDDDYYGGAEDGAGDATDAEDNEKPVFTDDEDEDLKILNWDQWETEEKPKLKEERKLSKKERKALKKKRKEQEEAELQDPEFDMDAEPEAEEAAGSKKMSKLAKALLKKKPVFDPAGDKTFDEYFDEYYQLDCEDVIGGDLPCRFKYREVVPNDFGLDLEEIFGAKDQELNQWASLKKTTQYRPIKDEVNDVRVYKSKRNQIDLKRRILSSLYNPVEEEDERSEAEPEAEVEAEVEAEKAEEATTEAKAETGVAEAEAESGNKKKAKKRKREKELEAAVVAAEEVGEPVGGESNETRSKKSKKQTHHSKPKKNKNILESMSADRLQAYGIEPKKFHKKLKYGGKEAN